MKVSKKIKRILSEEEISLTELANRLDISVNNLSNKLKRDNFKTEELEFIADKLGYNVSVEFSKKKMSISDDSNVRFEYTDEDHKEIPPDMMKLMNSDVFNENYKIVITNEIESHIHKVNRELLEKAMFKTMIGNPLSIKED